MDAVYYWTELDSIGKTLKKEKPVNRVQTGALTLSACAPKTKKESVSGYRFVVKQ